jgi:hypothetical protein
VRQVKFWIFCRVSHGELSRNVVGRLTVNFSIFSRESQCELSRYFVWRLTVNYIDTSSGVSWNLDVLSDVSPLLSLIFCRAPHSEISRYIVGRLTVNFLDILLGISPSIISIFCRESYGELSLNALQTIMPCSSSQNNITITTLPFNINVYKVSPGILILCFK